MANYKIAQLDELPAVPCPCGSSRRGLAGEDNSVATVHLVDIREDAQAHFHKKLTEIYVVLEGEGFLELDGEKVPVRPLSAVMIKPGCVHRAVGKLRILNIPVPAFDENDEWVV